MIITSSKRDDILKRKADYEADKALRQTRYDEQVEKYDAAVDAVCNNAANYVRSKLSGLDKLDIEVWGDRVFRSQGIQINVKVNERKLFDADNALSWTYQVQLDRSGNLQKESSSWSGLQAVTEAQMDSLRQTLTALEILNSIDWMPVVNVDVPKFSDYTTEKDPRYEQAPNFDQELLEADIEDAIGNNVLIKGDSHNYSWVNRDGSYYGILKETASQYTIFELPARRLEQIASDYEAESLSKYVERAGKPYSYRVSKSTFRKLIYTPVETITY